MREILDALRRWRRAGTPAAVATVVKTWGSAPRPLGAKMAVSADGAIDGSVSGGCVEGAVVEVARDVLASGCPRLAPFGVADDVAWAVGLSCGGEIEVWVEPWPVASEGVPRLAEEALEGRRLAAVATVVDGEKAGLKAILFADGSSAGDPALVTATRAEVAAAFSRQAARRLSVEVEGVTTEVFLDVLAPPPRLFVVGAVHAAIPLTRFAHELGFETHVVDPRAAFATRARFPHVDQLHDAWPDRVLEEANLDEASYVATLSHDPKLDLPALRVALRSPARYLGALGSSRTHAKRVAALTEEGFAAEQIARIHAPIGLDLGGRRAEEIALAVMAEIVAVRHGRRERLD